MNIKLELLQKKDAEQLFQFETENRAFFETMVPSRGDNYYRYDQFLRIMEELLSEQADSKSFFYLIKDENSRIVGRMNLVDLDLDKKAVEIGYRIGEPFLKKGVATNALRLILNEAEKMDIRTIYAKTTLDNIGSQKVLENNGFLRQTDYKDPEFIHYVSLSI
jgi:[ribosomal protein S5]-alanine N-acetyltransferase